MRSSVTSLLVFMLFSSSAMAAVMPAPAAKDDQHMQVATYAPGEVFVLHLIVGRTVAIELPAVETHNQAYGSDSNYVKAAIPQGTNLIFLKPEKSMAPKPFFINAALADEKNKLYTLEIDVIDASAPVTVPLPYRLKFIDKAADYAAKVAIWQVQQKKIQADKVAADLRYAVAHPVDTNKKYVLQGLTQADWNLLPTRRVGDDGQNTHFYLPGARATLIYTVSPDGKESMADCSPDSETHITTCHQLAAQWRLRDGDAVLCIFNHAFDPIGTPSQNGTASPDYRRETAR